MMPTPTSASGFSLTTPATGESLARTRYSELADVLLGCAGVASGRRFGRDCLKLGRRPFIVLDRLALAFLTGSERVMRAYPSAWLWNPNGERTPKHTWLACLPHDQRLICLLAELAYDCVSERAR